MTKSGVALGVGLGVYEAFQQPETARLLRRMEGALKDAQSRGGRKVAESIDASKAYGRKKAAPLPNQAEYSDFLKSLQLRYIADYEVLSAHRRERNGIANSLPPRALWQAIVPTLRVADELRHRLGVPLTHIASAYRSPEYNRQCPGAAKYSKHLKNEALDLVFACNSKAAFDEAQAMRREGLFCGGIGLYKNFIHVDTRGRNATWGA